MSLEKHKTDPTLQMQRLRLKDRLRLCAKNRTVIRYKPMVRVGTVCRQALKEIERLEAELARRLPVYDPEDYGVRADPPCGDCNERGHCTMNCGPSVPPQEASDAGA